MYCGPLLVTIEPLKMMHLTLARMRAHREPPKRSRNAIVASLQCVIAVLHE
jgi:hypothetical protein